MVEDNGCEFLKRVSAISFQSLIDLNHGMLGLLKKTAAFHSVGKSRSLHFPRYASLIRTFFLRQIKSKGNEKPFDIAGISLYPVFDIAEFDCSERKKANAKSNLFQLILTLADVLREPQNVASMILNLLTFNDHSN